MGHHKPEKEEECSCVHACQCCRASLRVISSAAYDPSVSHSVFTITEKAPTIGPSPGCNAVLAGKVVLHLFIY